MQKRLLVVPFSLCALLTIFPKLVLSEVVTVGAASYRTDLPKLENGKSRRSIAARPLLSKRIKTAVPTNDWCSSLVWPEKTPYSLPMFAHPLTLQARDDGLGLGYNTQATISHSLKDGKRFQTATSYRYPYRESMIVGLEGFTSDRCVLDDHADWSITALWRDGSDELRATFGHGMPFTYFERQSSRDVRIQFTAAKVNRHEQPVAPLAFGLQGITAKHTGEPGRIHFALNAGKNAGIGSKARIRYDFNGDGKTDRVETFGLFATDPSASTWENYSAERYPLDSGLTHGERKDFENGSVTVEFWKCFGEGELQLQLADCHVELPMADGKRFPGSNGQLKTQAEKGTASVGQGKATKAQVFSCGNDGATLGVTVNGAHYGIFAPSGSTWLNGELPIPPNETTASDASIGCDEISTDLSGKDYLSMAVLPDANPSTLALFQQFAFAFVSDTRVSYTYDPDHASVRTTFSATTNAKETTAAGTLFALYPHQYRHLAIDESGSSDSRSNAIVTSHEYVSPRGNMKVVAGQAFTTNTPYLGILPALPTANATTEELVEMLQRYSKQLESMKQPFQHRDTYWNGKEFGKICEVTHIAHQLGQFAIRDRLIAMLEKRLEDWFHADSDFFFYYDPTWNTLIGYPDSYGSGDQLNDHHFHYSYFIKAAATIALYDPEWAQPKNFGQMIDLLIRNCANYDRSDQRFPWMRFFDPYAGHSWASGHAGFASGNNQESSSESMNFATSLILYGEATKNPTIRDLGIYWHATEAEAIRNYWFDDRGDVFPEGYGHTCVGMIWGDGGTYGTWWTANPEEIHGINYLPITGGSLYLGRSPEYTKRNFANLVSANRNFHQGGFDGDPERLDPWNDILCEYLALSDAEEAAKRYRDNGRDKKSEVGETKIHTIQWIGALRELGQFDESVRANHPMAVCFVRDNRRTYIIYNASTKTIRVTYSDTTTFNASPGLNRFVR